MVEEEKKMDDRVLYILICREEMKKRIGKNLMKKQRSKNRGNEMSYNIVHVT